MSTRTSKHPHSARRSKVLRSIPQTQCYIISDTSPFVYGFDAVLMMRNIYRIDSSFISDALLHVYTEHRLST